MMNPKLHTTIQFRSSGTPTEVELLQIIIIITGNFLQPEAVPLKDKGRVGVSNVRPLETFKKRPPHPIQAVHANRRYRAQIGKDVQISMYFEKEVPAHINIFCGCPSQEI
jgi:hypothetical protein